MSPAPAPLSPKSPQSDQHRVALTTKPRRPGRRGFELSKPRRHRERRHHRHLERRATGVPTWPVGSSAVGSNNAAALWSVIISGVLAGVGLGGLAVALGGSRR